jgi:hypothetical protein
VFALARFTALSIAAKLAPSGYCPLMAQSGPRATSDLSPQSTPERTLASVAPREMESKRDVASSKVLNDGRGTTVTA